METNAWDFQGARTCQDVLERELDVAGVEGGSLDEGKVVFACAVAR